MKTQLIMFAIVASMVVMLVPSAMAEDNVVEIEILNAMISTLETENIALHTDIANNTQKNMDRRTAIHAYQEKADSQQAKIDTTLDRMQIMEDAAPLSKVQTMFYNLYRSDVVQSQSELDFVIDKIKYLVDKMSSSNESIISAQKELDRNVGKIAHLELSVIFLQAHVSVD